jgi:hypothetical protein
LLTGKGVEGKLVRHRTSLAGAVVAPITQPARG